MKVFVTGVNGQLGHDVAKELLNRGHFAVCSGSGPEYRGTEDLKAIATSVEALCGDAGRSWMGTPYVRLDITDKEAVWHAITRIRPDAVVHCAAWTAVDAAEDEENREKVDRINHLGTGYIADAAKAVGAKMLYLSTDYVFDGKGTRPWKPDDTCFAPLNTYGQSKLDGEMAVSRTLDRFFIVRIAWVFGLNGNNFIKTMIRAGKTHDAVHVVNDQIGSPTYTVDLSRLLIDMIETDKYGYYHATNEGGYISWFDFCRAFYKQYGLHTKVIPVTTEEYGLSRAVRPKNSRLDTSKLLEAGFTPLPSWQDAVSRYLKEASL